MNEREKQFDYRFWGACFFIMPLMPLMVFTCASLTTNGLLQAFIGLTGCAAAVYMALVVDDMPAAARKVRYEEETYYQ